MKKQAKKKPFDRSIKYDRASIFRSFLEHQLTGLSQDIHSKVMKAFNRSITVILHSKRLIRKPANVEAVGGIDPKIIHGAKRVLNTTTSHINGYETLAQLLLIAINPAMQLIRVGGCERELAKLHSDTADDYRLMWEFFKQDYNARGLIRPIADMHIKVALYLIEYNSIEGGTYVVSYTDEDPKNSMFGKPTILIKKEERSKAFKVEGKSRTAFGVGTLAFGRFSWAEIKGMPVYIQHHAINRLVERTAPIHDAKADVWITVCNSVMQPTIIERDGEFLLECAYCDQKIGYFVCQIVDGAVLITTFIFLTMDGTPEGEVLWKKLRIGRRDKEYLGLDSLRLFITSDLRSDLELVGLLKECKCGHLLEVEHKPDRLVAGVANDVMKYLSTNKHVMRLLEN
jgi:hypothetical protein